MMEQPAIPIAARDQPDIVLLDTILPGLDGFAVADLLRALPGLKHKTIVTMPGQVRAEEAKSGPLCFDHDDLLAFIRTRMTEAEGA